ncbi:ABC-type nitrate/sulfonate/bicarbonate transport system, substrate-binding protein [Pseudonocardia thermophila]|uniref:ABC-type nitrate/sulfonate/bicarbonate transport system, substrate-binding protein n=1 Tax=Pseudonocardia thermophila TaxID=1848 RepID=A0A1M6PQF5_PSETH|nr:ABC transporter substrate-binding protein [Pseudonocardia thermophila]SHK10209.1 ABC-type nitrate/sulfonate/bicarbonate transport system, substrate-binding protein [Pseudonocardia thermophila]
MSSVLPPAPSRRRFLQLSAAAGAAAFGASALAACASPDPDPAAAASGKVKLTHASMDPLVLWAVTYLAEDRGLYREEGLEIERVPLGGGPPALAALLTGAGQANLSAPGELLAAVGKGQELKVLMAHTNSMPSLFVVSREYAAKIGITGDSPVEERRIAIGRVPGGRFGITAPGSQTDGFTRLALRQAGLDPATQAQIVPLQNGANMLAGLANGQIDGFVGVPPVGEKAVVEFGAVPLLLNQAGEIEGGQRMQGMTMQARAEDVEAHPDLYRALVRADVRAMRELVEDPAGAGELLRRTRFGQIEEPVFAYAWDLIQRAWGSPYVTADSLTAWFDLGLVADANPAGFPFDEVLDMRFVDEALGSLGWTPPHV